RECSRHAERWQFHVWFTPLNEPPQPPPAWVSGQPCQSLFFGQQADDREAIKRVGGAHGDPSLSARRKLGPLRALWTDRLACWRVAPLARKCALPWHKAARCADRAY